jgi:ATP-dependent RNA helicase DDX55/SPB4
MPELKLFKDINFEPSKGVKIEEIRFRDKAREKQRQANIRKRALQPAKEVEERPRRVESTPWSNKQAQKEKRVERKEKKSRKREAIENAKAAQKEHDEDDDDIEDEYKALMREKRLAKKLNIGNIAQSDLESEASSEAEED